MLKKILLTTLLIAIFLPTAVLSQEEDKDNFDPLLTIAPSILDLDVNRKQEIERKISVTNNSGLPIPIKIEVNDYTVDEQGVPDYSEDTSEWSPKDWIKTDPSDLIIKPSEIKEIALSITIPEYAQNGSHFATVFFKPVLPPEYFEKDSAYVIPYIGAVVSLSVKDKDLVTGEDYLEIKEFLKGETENEEKEEFFSKMYNDDVYFHKVTGNIVITNIFNKQVAVHPIDSVTLFPQKVRSLTNILDQDFPFGRYRAELQVSDESEQTFRNLVFWEKPTVWEIVFISIRIILLILLIGVALLVVIKRNNLKKAIVILFSNRK
jgi:hypothetical protein